MELLGPEAWRHRDELSEVKRRLGVNHDKFDCWMYKFLENKNFDIDETVAKLQRRAEMERSLLDYEMTDQLRDMMRLGITQIIGDDKEGRLTLYVVTKRDFPKAEVREERKKNFDMWFSYATRIRRGEPRCRITMLINQKDASVWANSDMTFQTNIAIRMSKFYPGMFDRAYVCCMGGALGAFAKPIIKAMPKSISEKIFFFSEKQVHRDKVLHQYFDPAIIPVDLGGTNDCDHPANWNKFAENVEEYFANVKAAISRGMSVKEYEQSVVEEEERQIAELERQARDKKREEDRLLYEQSATSLLAASFGGASRKRWKQQRSGATTGGSSVATSLDACRVIDPETVSLVTADSGDDEDFGSALGTPRLGPVGCPTSLSRQLVILDSLHCISQIEEFLRLSIVHQHDLYLEEMSRLHLSARARHGATQKENDAGDQALQLAKRCPAPARSLTRGILMTVSVIMTIFFVGATLFLVLSASAIVVVMFLSIFINSWNMLPLAFGVILVGNQMGLVGSRGFDLVRNTFRGQLIRPLVVLPNHRTALVLQFLGFIIILVAVLAVFITYTSIDTPLNGIRFALGAGMYACAIVIGLYHAGFPFGLCPDVDHEEERSRSGFSLHLFFNIDEDSSALENRSVTSTIIVTLIPALCALLSGISFMLDASLLFIIATLALTLAAAFSVNHFVRGDHTNINGNLLRGTSWLTCVYWIVIAFIIGLAGLPDMLQGEVIGSTIIVFYFIVLSITCYYLTHTKTPYRVAFRWAYASYSALILAGLITSFLVHWAFGLVMVLLLVHGVACFMRPRSTAMIGSLVTVAVIMFVGLTLILYAYQSASLWDDISKTGAKLEYVPAQRLRHPVCGQHWGDATMLDSSLDPNVLLATDLALFNVLSYYRNTSAINAALNVLFPSFKMTSIQMPQNGMVVMHVFESSKPDMKVVSFVPGSDKLTDMQGLSMWAEAIALQPYGLVLPVNWTAQIVASVAGLTQLFPLPYKNMLDDVEGIVNSIINASSPDTTLLLTGHNYGGGVASVIGSKLHIATVSFDGPGSLISKYKFGIKEWDYLQYVTSVNSASSTLSNVDEPGPTLQGWSCPNDIVTCSQVKTAFCLLQSICGTHLNRSYVGCVSDPPPATTPPRRT